mmetsp:Transcript_64865/g.120674  ORF Transcript_64865/g.120674 Transcript_64865/m.120674 type:complete len:524 (-) Transcript_64865:29-1600(-)
MTSKPLRPPGIDTAVAGPPLVGSVRFSASGPAFGAKSPCVSHLVLSPESPMGQPASVLSSPSGPGRLMQPMSSAGGRSSVLSGSPIGQSSPINGMLSGVEVQTRLASSPKGTCGTAQEPGAVFQCSPPRGAIPVPTQTIAQPVPTQRVVSGVPGPQASAAGHGIATWAAANVEVMAPRDNARTTAQLPTVSDAAGPTILDRPATNVLVSSMIVEEDDASSRPAVEKVSFDGSVAQLVKTTVLFKCPVCSKVMPSREEAATHCLEAQAPAAAEAAEETAAAGTLRPLEGEAIAYDARGLATIVRQQDPSTGRKRTIVRNEDGSHDVFGESTVASLMEEKETKAMEWLNGLSNHQLFGLNHEIGQRLVESSKLYQDQKAQYDKYRVEQDYQYFGLSADASDKDLDVAYRKLARQMHPDKQHHKGVPLEQAKEEFQQMKKRYENLKQARAEAAGKTDEKADDEEKEEGADEEQKEDQEQETSIKYDPTNRDSLTENAHKMLKQLKQLRSSCHDISHNLNLLRPSGE